MLGSQLPVENTRSLKLREEVDLTCASCRTGADVFTQQSQRDRGCLNGCGMNET